MKTEKRLAKAKLSVTIEQELREFLDKQIESGRFYSDTHGVEFALRHLKNHPECMSKP